MTQPSTSARPRSTSPDGGAELATVDWVVGVVHDRVRPVEGRMRTVVMATAWALDLAGATRAQVAEVLADQPMRAALASILETVSRMRPESSLPGWARVVTRLDPADRRAIADHLERMAAEDGTRVPAEESAIFAILRGHPRAVLAHDRSFVEVPDGAFGVLIAAARTVTPRDVDDLLERARVPFHRRMAAAAAPRATADAHSAA